MHVCPSGGCSFALGVFPQLLIPLSFEAGTLTEPGASCSSTRLTDQQGLATLSSASQTQQKGSVSKQPCPAPDISRYPTLGPLFARQALCQSNHVLIP